MVKRGLNASRLCIIPRKSSDNFGLVFEVLKSPDCMVKSYGGGFGRVCTKLFFLSVLVIYVKLLFSRLYGLVKNYLNCPSSGLYSCPLAMTDGAAKIIEVSDL